LHFLNPTLLLPAMAQAARRTGAPSVPGTRPGARTTSRRRARSGSGTAPQTVTTARYSAPHCRAPRRSDRRPSRAASPTGRAPRYSSVPSTVHCAQIKPNQTKPNAFAHATAAAAAPSRALPRGPARNTPRALCSCGASARKWRTGARATGARSPCRGACFTRRPLSRICQTDTQTPIVI
jgi:hypothetical protein